MSFFGNVKAQMNFKTALDKYGPDHEITKAEYEKLVKEGGAEAAEKFANPLIEKVQGGDLIFNSNSSTEELNKQNSQTMLSIKNHEAGSSWAGLASALTLDPATQMQAKMLKSIAEQQKILIRQNEIIIRILSEK